MENNNNIIKIKDQFQVFFNFDLLENSYNFQFGFFREPQLFPGIKNPKMLP